MWQWKVPKWPWFLNEVAVKPFWDLATLLGTVAAKLIYDLCFKFGAFFSPVVQLLGQAMKASY
jgi:hypothetical protein